MSGRAVDFYSDGVRCSALLWEPEGASAPVPGVVLCHGFRGIKEWSLPDFAEDFAARGYAALVIDYRGFGESDGPRGRLIPDEQVEDIRNAVTFLSGRPAVDPERIAVYGTSFGGANVIQAAALDERIRATVCQVGFGSAQRVLGGIGDRLRERLDADRAERVLTGITDRIDPGELLNNPQSNAAFAVMEERFPQLRQTFPLSAIERILEYRPERFVAEISPRAVLFIGAANDAATPIEETYRLYEQAREPKQLETFDITHYEIYESPHRERAVALASAFFDEHLSSAVPTTHQENPVSNSTTDRTPQQTMEAVWAAFGTGRVLEELENLFAEDAVIKVEGAPHVPFVGVFTGREAQRDFFALGGAQPQRFDIGKQFVEGDDVITLGSFDFLVTSTGRHYDGDWALHTRIVDGQIVHWQMFENSWSVGTAFDVV